MDLCLKNAIVIIILSISLSLVQYQVITWTNIDLFAILDPLKEYPVKIEWKSNNCTQENIFHVSVAKYLPFNYVISEIVSVIT